MKKLFKNRMFVSVFLSVSVAFIFVFVAVQAATTISTSITTGGNLTVSGTAAVAGATTLSSTLTAAGLTVISGQFQASSTSLFGGNMDILGSASSTSLVVQGTASTTALKVGGGNTISGLLFGTCAFAANGAITASTTQSSQCSGATGVVTTDKVFVTPRFIETGLVLIGASSTVNGAIQVSVFNMAMATGTFQPASTTWSWMAIR